VENGNRAKYRIFMEVLCTFCLYNILPLKYLISQTNLVNKLYGSFFFFELKLCLLIGNKVMALNQTKPSLMALNSEV